MKALLFTAAALAVLSTPAAAADWQGKTYGQDAIGVYNLSATVDTFCKFGTSTSGETVSGQVTVTPGAPGTAAEADGTFAFDIQNDNDNTVQGAFGRYRIGYAVCNTAHNMNLNSQNGGLRNAATTSDTAFTSLVPYNVGILFDGNGGSAASSTFVGGRDFSTVNEARAGAAEVNVEVLAQDKLLIRGTYSDRLIATIRPNV